MDGRAPAPPRFATALFRAQNAVVGWDQPSPALSDGTAGEAGGSGPPASAPSPTLPRVLAPRARNRHHIVPADRLKSRRRIERCGHRLRWTTLLAWVFSSDISECTACGGRLRIIAALTDPASIRTYLEGLGLPAMPPPRAPAATTVRVRRLTYLLDPAPGVRWGVPSKLPQAPD